MKKIKLILLSLLAPGVIISTQASAPPVPTGVFYLPSSQTLDQTAIDNSDGVVIGGAWSDLEPTEGNYVFNVAAHGQSLDAQLAQVEASNGGLGKPMRLAIATGGPDVLGNGPGTSKGAKPHWLTTKISADTYTGGKFFTYKDSATTTATIPVFWEPTLLSKHALLAQAVANHLASHPLVRIVFVPYANANTNDWNLGDTSNAVDGIAPSGSTPQTRWITALVNSGYAYMSDALIAAGNSTYSAYHTAFPNGILTTSIGRLQNTALNPGGGGTVNGRNISESVVSTANTNWPGFIVAQKNNLNGGGVTAAPGGTSAWNDLYILHTTYGVPTAAQMVWHAYGDCATYGAERMNMGFGSPCADSTQMLYQAVNAGGTYATKWQELYELDILNLGASNGDPGIPIGVPSDVIGYAHTHLYHPTPVALTGMVSRQTQGTAGTFDIDLTNGSGVESRSTSGAYQLILTFANNLTSVGGASSTCGTVSSAVPGPAANQYTVNLSGMGSCNATRNTVTLTNVDDSVGDHSDSFTSPRWGLLIGDVDGDGSVTQADVSQTRGAIGSTVTISNFTDDVNLSGTINNADVSIVKNSVGTVLSP